MNTPTVIQASVRRLITKELIIDQRGIDTILERFKNCVIVCALRHTRGNVTMAARLLKTSRNNLMRWMAESGIDRYFPVEPEEIGRTA